MARGQIQQPTISVKRQPLQQQQEVTTSTEPPVSEALLEMFEEIKETNFKDGAAVDALSVSLMEGLTEKDPKTLSFSQGLATSSPDVRPTVPSIIPELSEGFGTSTLPELLSPIGTQLSNLGIDPPDSGVVFHSKQLEIKPPEVGSVSPPTVTPTVGVGKPASGLYTQEEIKDINQKNILLGDDPYSEDLGKSFDLSDTDLPQVAKQVGALNFLKSAGMEAGFGGKDFQEIVKDRFKGSILNSATLGTLGAVAPATYIKDFLKSDNLTNPFAVTTALGAATQVIDTTERLYQKAARADSITGFLNGVKDDVLGTIEGFWGLATDPITTVKAWGNNQLYGAYSPDITNIKLAHGTLGYVQDERGELTSPKGIDTILGLTPLGAMKRVWDWGVGFTDFSKENLERLENFADAAMTPDKYIDNNMSTYSSGKNNYVNFTERLIGDTDIGQFNGVLNLNALVGKNVNDLTWGDINSAFVNTPLVHYDSDREQILNSVKNNLGALESGFQGVDQMMGVGVTGDITSIANNVRDVHAPVLEEYYNNFKVQYDYLVGQDPGLANTFAGYAGFDVGGLPATTPGVWDEDKKEYVGTVRPSDFLSPFDKYGRDNQSKVIRDFYKNTVANDVFMDPELRNEDYVDFNGDVLAGRVDNFKTSIVQEAYYTHGQDRDLFSSRNQIATAAHNITGKNYGSNEELHPGKDKEFAAEVLNWAYSTGTKPTEEDLKYLAQQVYGAGQEPAPAVAEKVVTATGEEVAPPTKKINVEEETAKLMRRKAAAVREAQAGDKPAEGLPRYGTEVHKVAPTAKQLDIFDKDYNLKKDDLYMSGLEPWQVPIRTPSSEESLLPIGKEGVGGFTTAEGKAKTYGGDNFVAKPEADALPSWFSDDPQLEDDPGFDDVKVDTRTAYEKGISAAAAPVDHLGGFKTDVVAPPATKLPMMLYPERVERPDPSIARTPPPSRFDTQISDVFSKTGKYGYLPSKQELRLDRDEFEQGKIMGGYTAYDTAEADKKFIDGVIESTNKGIKEAKNNNDPKTIDILKRIQEESIHDLNMSVNEAAERLDGPKPEAKNTWDASLGKFIGDTPTVEKAAVQRDAEITVSPSDFTGFGIKEERDLIAQHAGEPVLNPTFKDAVDKKGVDVEIPEGGNVTAAVDGKIVYSDHFRGFGHLIITENPNGVQTLYGGIKPGEKKVGDRLFAGDTVGTVVRSSLDAGSVYIEQRKDGKVTSASRKALINAINSGKHISVGGSDRSQAATSGKLVTDPAVLKAFQEEPPAPPPPAPLPVFRPPQRQPVYDDPITDHPGSTADTPVGETDWYV